MKKVFLFLYPVKEYFKSLMLTDGGYVSLNIPHPIPIMNECIKKRYRDKGYDVVFAMYPDKEIFGLEKQPQDKIIYTDVKFDDVSQLDEKRNIKKDFVPQYPDPVKLLSQLGTVDKLVVSGFHATDCVKRIALAGEKFFDDVSIDIDLTDFFFHLYRCDDYFKIDNYSPKRYKRYIVSKAKEYNETMALEKFNDMFGEPVYGFNFESELNK